MIWLAMNILMIFVIATAFVLTGIGISVRRNDNKYWDDMNENSDNSDIKYLDDI